MAETRTLRERLAGGDTVYGQFVRLATPQAVEILGYAGWDFVIIDLEHGSLWFETAENLVRAAQLTGVVSVIRTPDATPTWVMRALDMGAVGIQVPGIENAAQASAVVRAARYHPQGQRGVCRFVRAAHYSAIPVDQYFSGANAQTIVVLHVEGGEGVRNLDEILAVDGVDVIFLGPYDLSQYLGRPGEVDHPEVVDLCRSLAEKIRARNRAVGIFVDPNGDVDRWRRLGIQYIATGPDTRMMLHAAQDLLARVRR